MARWMEKPVSWRGVPPWAEWSRHQEELGFVGRSGNQKNLSCVTSVNLSCVTSLIAVKEWAEEDQEKHVLTLKNEWA